MREEKGQIQSDVLVSEDTRITGLVAGNVRVERARLELGGMIAGDLVIDTGAVVDLRGMVTGNVRNVGGTVVIKGMVDGDVEGSAATTSIDARAVVKGAKRLR